MTLLIINVRIKYYYRCPLSCTTEICRTSLRRVYGISTDSNLVTTVRQVKKQESEQSGIKRKNFVFKVVLLGNAAVGKTSIISRFSNGTFDGKTTASIGCDICMKTMIVGNANVQLVLVRKLIYSK
ncbi:unnamed protein product [Orchesella dallaii]|uniref:Uncharacterized protein n=1 Tax=Orchesella dallaii TaxID=48710 RepID=A0ABP1RHP9_9HEXA